MDTVKHAKDSAPLEVKVVLCAGRNALDRYGRILRHFGVGLIDQAVQIRWVSDDDRVKQLALGPMQVITHAHAGWSNRKHTKSQFVDSLAHDPPTTVHALSAGDYSLAGSLAEAFEADLIVQVSSIEDCDRITRDINTPVSRYVATSTPLADVLTTQLSIPTDRIEIIRPGTLASPEIACFAHPDATPTILCTAPLTKGSGVMALIEAVGLIRAKGSACLVFLLGAGKEEHRLRTLVGELKLESAVTFASFLGDPLNAMQGADFYVQPSPQDGFFVNTLHAMASGTLLITATNAACDHMLHEKTAVVCDTITASVLAEAIERFLADHSSAERLATDARDYVKAHHAVSAMAERAAALYRRLAISRATFSFKE